ncbi:MAG TPA: alanine racemase [Anaerohalosphaeraceae bacterium]|nr:alanine racemase [Anaerohalosphaeraceae bacterium]
MNTTQLPQLIRPDLQAHIYSDQLLTNVRNLRTFCPARTRFCAVVKANAYGHGIGEVVGILNNYVDAFAVATFYEALHIEPMTGGKPILILEPVNPAYTPEQIKLCARYGFHCELSSLEGMEYVHSVLQGSDLRISLHLNVETGMGRCGLDEPICSAILQRLPDCPNIRLAGIMTHFATADEDDLSYAYEQLFRFERFLSEHRLKDRNDILIHACNSAGTLKIPQAHYDMVRCGVSMYGYYSRPMKNPPVPLTPVLKLQAPITQLKKIPAGHSVSYGRSFIPKRDTLAAIVYLGYADGYRRCFSNRAQMKIDQWLAPVVGRVCMDQVILDVTDVPNVKLGQMVTVLDNQHDSPCGAYALSQLADTICYEILTMIHSHVKRIVH